MPGNEVEPDFAVVLRALLSAHVDVIVVGGVAAALHGAAVSTFDVDLVYSRAAANRVRIEAVLRELRAVYREKPSVAPTAALLDSAGHHLLMTAFGPLDLLGSTVGGGYEELLPHTEEVDLGEIGRVRILDLPTLIEMKERLGRDRDRAVLPILRRTLEERRKSSESSAETAGNE